MEVISCVNRIPTKKQEVTRFSEKRKNPWNSKSFKGLVETTGLEPVTSCVWMRPVVPRQVSERQNHCAPRDWAIFFCASAVRLSRSVLLFVGKTMIRQKHPEVKSTTSFMQLWLQKQTRWKQSANIFFTTLWLPPPASILPPVQSSCTADQRLCFFFYKNIVCHVRTTDKGLPPAIIKSSRGEHKTPTKTKNKKIKGETTMNANLMIAYYPCSIYYHRHKTSLFLLNC